MTTMSYKTFLFPYNPETITVTTQSRIATAHCPEYGPVHQNLGLARRVIRAQGCFYGADAKERFAALESLMWSDGAGLLRIPGLGVVTAYLTALTLNGEGDVREVCLYFGGKLLRGNRATKYSADGLIAFVSPNYPILAEAGISIRYNESALLPGQKGGLKLQTLDPVPIGVIKVFPGIQFSLFESIMTEKLRGIVIETFGAGNIPGDGDALLPIIRKAFQNGTVLTVCSQCPQGAVSLGAYETSSALKKAGAVSGLDMTTEAAVAKLYYLFSLNLGKEEIKRAMEQDLRGEITVL